MKRCPSLTSKFLQLGLLLWAVQSIQAGLGTPRGLWQLNNSFAATQAGYGPLNPVGLANGSDYSFATDGAGYQYLQSQPFSDPAKRLTVTNPIGPQGGSGATRTHQWSVVMDVKFDSFSPYAGVLQLDSANTEDVTLYLQPGASASVGTLILRGIAVSAEGAVNLNTWYRLAITSTNNGAGGNPTLSFYLNGVSTGISYLSVFNSSSTMGSTFHLFTDDNGELRPAKLGSLGLWGETLAPADIASLGAPSPEGITAYSLSYPGAPSTWGTWIQDTYFGMTPRYISATADPDGRLRLVFLNQRVPAMYPYPQTIMFTYRRADGGFREAQALSLFYGNPLGTPWTVQNREDYGSSPYTGLPIRSKVLAVDRGSELEVRASMTLDSNLDSGSTNEIVFARSPASFPFFPAKPWAYHVDNGVFKIMESTTRAGSIALSEAGSVQSLATDNGNNSLVSLTPEYKIDGQTLSGPIAQDVGQGVVNSIARVASLDMALTDDGKDCYFLLNTGLQDPSTSPVSVRSALTVIRQQLTSATVLGAKTATVAANVTHTFAQSGRDSVHRYAKILLTHAEGAPKWVVWTDQYTNRTHIARRVPPIPDANPATNEDRMVIAGYQTLALPVAFSDGCDAALDGLDRLHLVWRNPLGGEVRYARESSTGTFQEIGLPTPASTPPAITIGPGDYPYIAYAGADTVNPSESAPLIITLPPGLIPAYKGDYEDRDRDGRPGLIERAQGSSDQQAEGSTTLNALTLAPSLGTSSPGVQKFQAGFRVAYNSLRGGVSNSPVWNLADGVDTIETQLSYSYDGMQKFYLGGFTVEEEFTINNAIRYLTVRDSASTTQQRRAFYRLFVRRIKGAP